MFVRAAFPEEQQLLVSQYVLNLRSSLEFWVLLDAILVLGVHLSAETMERKEDSLSLLWLPARPSHPPPWAGLQDRAAGNSLELWSHDQGSQHQHCSYSALTQTSHILLLFTSQSIRMKNGINRERQSSQTPSSSLWLDLVCSFNINDSDSEESDWNAQCWRATSGYAAALFSPAASSVYISEDLQRSQPSGELTGAKVTKCSFSCRLPEAVDWGLGERGVWSVWVLLMRPQQRRFLAVSSAICGLIIARAAWLNFPPLLGLRTLRKHTHLHTCTFSSLCYTVSTLFLCLSLCLSRSCMPFPDVSQCFELQSVSTALSERCDLWTVSC